MCSTRSSTEPVWVQVYNTFADKKNQVALPETHQAKTFSVDWAVQSLSGAAGAIIPYVLAGKAMGSGMRALGGELGLQGGAARFMASESAAQIMGAGAYDFIKAPNQGETRLGNAVGTMAGFSVFEAETIVGESRAYCGDDPNFASGADGRWQIWRRRGGRFDELRCSQPDDQFGHRTRKPVKHGRSPVCHGKWRFHQRRSSRRAKGFSQLLPILP